GRGGPFLSVLLPVRRHEQVDPLQLRIGYVLLTEIPAVCRRLRRRTPPRHFHFLQHGHQLLLVVGVLRHRGDHDHLCVTVHHRLRVISLHQLFRRSVLHDPRIRVGKIPLPFRFRFRLLWVRCLRRSPAELPSPFPLLLLPLL